MKEVLTTGVKEEEVHLQVRSGSDENLDPGEIVKILCIFKVFDDIRQDNLSIQIIKVFQQIFERLGLDIKLFPYKTISNRTGLDKNIGGIIEVLKNT